MANTYTQLNIQAIFSVKGRDNIITNNFKDDLFKYIAGILKNNNQYSLIVNGHRDHIHIFFELNPSYALSDIMRIVKANSSKWINNNKFLPGHFEWQEGYGAFSYSRSQRNHVINYIKKQEEHHKNQSFQREYMDLLKKFDIQFNSHYIFDFYD